MLGRPMEPIRPTARPVVVLLLLALCTLCGAAAPPALAQPPLFEEPTAQKEAIDALAFLEGTWEGAGWMARGPDYRATFTSREIVERELEGTVLVVRGLHDAQIPGHEEPVRVHDAMAVVSWDAEAGRYRFDTWTSRGAGTNGHGELLGENRFRWYPGSEDVRFTIGLDEEGRWHEIGERRGEDGAWSQFFEMTVARTGEGAGRATQE